MTRSNNLTILKTVPVNSDKVEPNDGREILPDKPEIPKWKFFLIELGFMKNNRNDSSINGTAIVFAVAFGLAMIYIFLGGTVSFLIAVDDKKAENMLDKTAVRRAQDQLNREQEKRAKLLEFNKSKGLYQEIPETLKTFEISDSAK